MFVVLPGGKRVFRRDYQADAAERALAHYGLTECAVLVAAPTGSGKSLIGHLISEGARYRGSQVLALAPTIDIVAQLNSIGLTAMTSQRFYTSCRRLLLGKEVAAGSDEFFIRWAQDLGMADGFFLNDLCILVDEGHFSLQKLTRLYSQSIARIRNLKLLVSFSATPRTDPLMKAALIDLYQVPEVRQVIANPLESHVSTFDHTTIGGVAALFPAPGLLFFSGMVEVAATAGFWNMMDGRRRCCIVVGSFRNSLSQAIEHAFKNANEDLTTHKSLSHAHFCRIKYIGALMVLDEIARLYGIHAIDHQTMISRSRELQGALFSMASFLDILSMLKSTFDDESYETFKSALVRNGDERAEAAGLIAERIVRSPVHIALSADEWQRQNIPYAISILKLAQGFDRVLNTIIIEKRVSEVNRDHEQDDDILRRQRMGRGSRRVAGSKEFFDFVEMSLVSSNSLGETDKTLVFRGADISRRRFSPSLRRQGDSV